MIEELLMGNRFIVSKAVPGVSYGAYLGPSNVATHSGLLIPLPKEPRANSQHKIFSYLFRLCQTLFSSIRVRAHISLSSGQDGVV